MAVEDAIIALREHWDDVLSLLTSEETGELRGLIGKLGGPDREQAVTRIVDLLVESLPPRHPVRRALAEGHLFAPPTIDWAAITSSFQDIIGGIAILDADPEADGPLSAADILRAVTGRLLAAPALSEHEVRQHGADPWDPGLIWLERPDGGRQWPMFQFAPGNGPLPVVRTINNLLGAETDPLGVADWWLSRNGWLDGQPSLLLGKISDDLLVSAARAVGSEV